MKYNPEVLQSIFARLSAGESVTMDEECMEQMPSALSDKATDHWFMHVSSVFNPERVGIRDKFVVSMKAYDPLA